MINSFQKKIAIIIPAYNAGYTIKQCLDSIINQDYPKLEIIVVNDASSDDTLEKVSKFNVKIITNAKNKGAAFSRNLGVKNSDSEIIIFVDSDVVIPSDAISSVNEIFLQQPNLLGVGGIYSDTIKYLNFISDYKNLELAYRCGLRPDFAKYLGSFFLAMKRTVFLGTGGFSVSFSGSSVEDIELGYRLTQGKKMMFISKDIKIDHLKKYTFFSMLKTDFIRIFNMMRIIKESKGKHKAGEEASLTYFINLVLPVLIIAAISTGAVSGMWMISVVLGIFFIFNNLSFLYFLAKKRGIKFSFMSIFVFFIEYLFAAFSVFLSFLSLSLNFKKKEKNNVPYVFE